MSTFIKKSAATLVAAAALFGGTAVVTDTAAHAATHCLAPTNLLRDFGCTVVVGNGASSAGRAL